MHEDLLRTRAQRRLPCSAAHRADAARPAAAPARALPPEPEPVPEQFRLPAASGGRAAPGSPRPAAVSQRTALLALIAACAALAVGVLAALGGLPEPWAAAAALIGGARGWTFADRVVAEA